MKKSNSVAPYIFEALGVFLLCTLLTSNAQSVSNVPPNTDPAPSKPPNILLVVMDDVGIDQMKVFGYGGENPPQTPNIDAVALAGVRFRNTWSQPTCSPTRASIFDGHYPIRTNMLTAIASTSDLANSAVSPHEYTTPKMLRRKNYTSALFGKMHLSGSQLNPALNPFGNKVMRKLGWNHFEGFLDGDPYPIDTTAGGVASTGTYGCGFVPSKADNATVGADTGACYTHQGATCAVLSTQTEASPGRTCLEKGGIFDPEKTCKSKAELPSYINFNTQNAYYTGDWVINREDGSTTILAPEDARGRGYRTIQEANRAIGWINQQSNERPWMASIGFSAMHAPIQPSPVALVPEGSPSTSASKCTTSAENEELATQMLEAMDHEFGRLLVETGLANFNSDGSLNYHPENSNTVVVILGDNGTWTTSVREPFDPARAKGTPYQTGVWVPLVIAGPRVQNPGREVSHMTNTVDLYRFFGEAAGINVSKVVPDSHTLDSKRLMPYLLDPSHGPIRKTNYTVVGNNLRSVTTPQYPCVVPSMNACTMVLPTQGACESQSGQWYGPNGVVGATGYTSCCQVNDYMASQGQPEVINNLSQRAIRDDKYKIVQNEIENCSGGESQKVNEFYEIDEALPTPKLDRAEDDLLSLTEPLTTQQSQHYNALLKKLGALESSFNECPGDGNLDKIVNEKDITEWAKFSATTGKTTPNGGGQSSWYDFNHDGLTDTDDKAIIESNMGAICQ